MKYEREVIIMKIKRKWYALALTVIMIAAMVPAAVFAVNVETDKAYGGGKLPAAPDMSGEVINVTPENAQYTLDGAYGNINGKTINFTKGEYNEVLKLARNTKFPGSGTVYYNMKWNGAAWVIDGEPVEDLADLKSQITTYKRTVEDVKLTSDEGAVFKGFAAGSGHDYHDSYDYVKDQVIVDSNNSYHGNSSLINITFEGLTIKEGIAINNYGLHAVNSDLTFKDCTFLGDASRMEENNFKGISLKADSRYYTDVTVTGCSFTNYFQGVYLQGVDGARIANNEINGTKHNAIALQSSKTNPVKGIVDVRENYIENVTDRAVRLGDADATLDMTFENNIILNSGDEDGELFKAQPLPAGSKVNLENNYWDGKDPAQAVANDEIVPQNVGIVGGEFNQEVKPEYCGDGFNPVQKPDGSFGVCDHSVTELINQKDATCQAEGYTGDTVCVNCRTVLAKGKVIGKVAHSYKDGKCIFCGAAESAAGGGSLNDDSAQTGDSFNPVLYGVIAVIALAGAAGAFAVRKRQK